MVGKFESPEFQAAAAKEEVRWTQRAEAAARWRSWLIGMSLLALLMLAVAMRRHSFRWGSLSNGQAQPELPSSPPVGVAPPLSLDAAPDGEFYRATFDRSIPSIPFGSDSEPGFRTGGGLSLGALPRPPSLPPEPRGMRPDFTLLGLIVAVAACCIGQRLASDTAAPWTAGSNLWPAGGSPWNANGATWAGGAGSAGVQQPPWASGRVPMGELASKNAAPWTAGSNPWPAGGSPWTASGAPWAGGMGAAGAQIAPWANGGTPGSGGIDQLGRAGLMGSVPNGLPSEREVADTLLAFGGQLQNWAPAVLQYVHRQIIETLLKNLESSDRQWRDALSQRGWHLVLEGGHPPAQQQLSVFESFLPPEFQYDTQAVSLWRERQRLESYLRPRGFQPWVQRPYVLERLRLWQCHGPLHTMQHEWRPCVDLPTDAHILENLLLTELGDDFDSCFVAKQMGRPVMQHLGQPHVAYLRQVADQSCVPRPPPHYEVVTGERAWRLRPGSTNLPEALGLLLHALRHHSGSYAAFPLALREAVEASEASHGGLVGAFARLQRNWRTLWSA